MQLRMWTYDLAREQAPTLDHLRTFFEVTRAGGYNAIGLYLEHRFAYPSTPWAHGKGCLTPEMVRTLIDEFPDIEVIPFVNLLGHMEGFLYTENGVRFAEEPFKGLQADPTNADLVRLAEAIIDDTLAIFPSHIIHIGGDETWQLGAGEGSKKVVAEYERTPGMDGKARLYADHFGPLARRITDAGRHPAVWGDMFFDHPTALKLIPGDTIIFDWQYFGGPRSRMFRDRNFDVVYCPALHTYNATWLHLPQSEENVRQHAVAAYQDKAYGVCVTTWELGLFGNYETILPAVKASGRMLQELEAKGESALPSPFLPPSTDPYHRRDDWPLNFEPNPQFPNERESFVSLAASLVDAIVRDFLDSQAKGGEIVRDGEDFVIRYIYPNRTDDTGRLSREPCGSVLNRLCLLAGMDPLRRNQVRQGTLRGTYKGVTFEIAATSTPTPEGLSFTFTTTPFPNGATYAAYRQAPHFLKAYLEDGETHEEFARLMGIELQDAGAPFAFTGIRSAMKCRMLLYSNPFLFWLRNREEILGEAGDKALEILEHAIAVSPNVSYRGCAEFARLSIEFVRQTEDARRLYAAGLPGESTNALIVCRQIFENLIKIARATNIRIGGSLADVERCLAAREHIEKVIRRVKNYGDGDLGYLPSFETLCHPKFIPHDQGNWWLINRWANE